MKKYIKLLLIIASTVAYSQNREINKDSVNTFEEVGINKIEFLKGIQNEINNFQKRKIDSLNREILYYKVKEDYYATALSEQSNKYIFITSGILAILALISFGIFKIEILRIKKYTKKKHFKQSEIFNKFKTDFEFLEINSFVTQANMNASIGVHFRGQNNLPLSLSYHLAAAVHHAKYTNAKNLGDDKTIETEDCKPILNNLLISIGIIEDIVLNDKLKLKIKESFKDYTDSIDQVYKFKNGDVKNKISEIRVRLTNYIA